MGPAPLCAQGSEGFLTPDPSYRPWQDTLSCSAVQTTAEVNRRNPRSSRQSRRCPAGPNTESRGAPLPEIGPQTGGDQRRPRQGLQLWPVLYLRARGGKAKRTGGDRVDTPGGDPRRPVPALALRRSESSSIRHRPSSRLRATSTFRFNVAAAAPPSGPASFRERCLAPPTPACEPPRHFRGRGQTGAEPGVAGGAPTLASPLRL